MDLFNKLLKSFEGEDELGVVIRAHIIIEQYLNTLIERIVADPKYLKAMNLDYSQTVQMALTLGLDPRFAPALSSLGKIRNEFAHSLVPNISKQAVNNLYSALDENTKSILNDGISKVSSEIGQNIKHKTSSNKQQFVYITSVLAAALHKACREAGIAT